VPGPPGYLNRRIFVDLSFPSLDSVIDFAARSGATLAFYLLATGGIRT
jgi:hypothetical protein